MFGLVIPVYDPGEHNHFIHDTFLITKKGIRMRRATSQQNKWEFRNLGHLNSLVRLGCFAHGNKLTLI